MTYKLLFNLLAFSVNAETIKNFDLNNAHFENADLITEGGTTTISSKSNALYTQVETHNVVALIEKWDDSRSIEIQYETHENPKADVFAVLSFSVGEKQQKIFALSRSDGTSSIYRTIVLSPNLLQEIQRDKKLSVSLKLLMFSDSSVKFKIHSISISDTQLDSGNLEAYETRGNKTFFGSDVQEVLVPKISQSSELVDLMSILQQSNDDLSMQILEIKNDEKEEIEVIVEKIRAEERKFEQGKMQYNTSYSDWMRIELPILEDERNAVATLNVDSLSVVNSLPQMVILQDKIDRLEVEYASLRTELESYSDWIMMNQNERLEAVLKQQSEELERLQSDLTKHKKLLNEVNLSPDKVDIEEATRKILLDSEMGCFKIAVDIGINFLKLTQNVSEIQTLIPMIQEERKGTHDVNGQIKKKIMNWESKSIFTKLAVKCGVRASGAIGQTLGNVVEIFAKHKWSSR